jgi:heme exporter protein D
LDAIMSFLSMGGYAAFIWPAFGVAAAVLIALFLVSWREAKAREAELEAMPRAEQRRERGRRS